MGVPFQVGGRLTVRSNQVLAEDIGLSVANLRLPGFVMNEVQRAVNPLYDFDPQQRWPVVVNLQTAGAQGNVMALSGGLQWVGFDRQRAPQPTPRNEPRYEPRYEPQYQPPYEPQYQPPYQPPYSGPQPTYRAPDYQIY
jgi:hypothetical protein